VAAEAAQAICNHIAARVAERAPASYGDCYFILEEQGIIEPDLAPAGQYGEIPQPVQYLRDLLNLNRY